MRAAFALVASIVALAPCSAGCSSRSASAHATSVVALTALGDSVPFGSGCHCTPYPKLSGSDIAHAADRVVHVTNDSVPGYRSLSVVRQLQGDSDVAAHVGASEVVLAEVGANDVAHSERCGANVACYDEKIPELRHNLATIVRRVHELTERHPVIVILIDYWSVWLGGQYARAQGPAYEAAADEVTEQVNSVIESVARSTGSVYVDLRTAFRGPDHSWDETHLLASDGDHPNAEGHQRIAQAIAHAVRTR